VIDEIAVLHQLANEGIDLLQTEWGLGAAFQIATNEAIFLDTHFERGGAGFIGCGRAVLLRQRQDAEDATHADFSLLAMDGIAERADVGAGAARSPQQLRSAQRSALGVIFGLDAIPTFASRSHEERSCVNVGTRSMRTFNLLFPSDGCVVQIWTSW
jgi:hypothetical protein